MNQPSLVKETQKTRVVLGAPSEAKRRYMLVRKFLPSDAEALSQIFIQNLRQVNIRDYPSEAIEALVRLYTPEQIIERAGKWITLVCTDGQDVVGTASLDNDRVREVFVAVSQHRTGIGKQLMHAIEMMAKEQHLEKLYLLAGISAEDFYKKLGYVVIKRFDNDLNGIPLRVIRMEKDI